jgi:hypothetical protein
VITRRVHVEGRDPSTSGHQPLHHVLLDEMVDPNMLLRRDESIRNTQDNAALAEQ